MFKEWLNRLDFTDRDFRELQDVGLIQPPPPIGGTNLEGTGDYRFNAGKFLRLVVEGDKKFRVSVAYLAAAGIAIAAVAEKGVNEEYVINLCQAAEDAGAIVHYPRMATHQS